MYMCPHGVQKIWECLQIFTQKEKINRFLLYQNAIQLMQFFPQVLSCFVSTCLLSKQIKKKAQNILDIYTFTYILVILTAREALIFLTERKVINHSERFVREKEVQPQFHTQTELKELPISLITACFGSKPLVRMVHSCENNYFPCSARQTLVPKAIISSFSQTLEFGHLLLRCAPIIADKNPQI